MSALAPHIAALRAEAATLLDQARDLRQRNHIEAALVILAIGEAKMNAADALEADQRAQIDAMLPTARAP